MLKARRKHRPLFKAKGALEAYLKAYTNGLEANDGLEAYFRFRNTQRVHQALRYRTDSEGFSCGSDTSPGQATERGGHQAKY